MKKKFTNILKKNKIEYKTEETIAVKLRGVNVAFGPVKAMKDVSLNIYKGEILGLVGESGSGKSTTGKAILGLLEKRQSGKINVLGVDVPTESTMIKKEIKEKLVSRGQMIFQDPSDSLNPQKNVYDVVSEGLDNVNVRELYLRKQIGEFVRGVNTLTTGNKEKSIFNSHNWETINELIFNKKYKEVINLVYDDFSLELEKYTGKNKELIKTLYSAKKEGAQSSITGGKRFEERLKRRMVIDLLSEVGLDSDSLGRYPLEFSGGQQQRISIARAIIMNPGFIVADEPISALDVSIQAQVVNIFKETRDRHNLTILFIAHDLRMVEYISDRIAVMYRGEVVEVGATEEIAQNPQHPYTKTLLESVPSIDKIKTNLKGKNYVPSDYIKKEEEKEWHQIGDKNHFVFAGKDEFKNFKVGEK